MLRSSIGKFEYLFLSFAADGGHVLAMNTLAHLLVTAKDAAFVRDTLKMTEKDGLAYFQKAADLNSGDAMSTLAIWYTLGKGDVDKNLARVETLFDKSEKPETSLMPMTSPEERGNRWTRSSGGT